MCWARRPATYPCPGELLVLPSKTLCGTLADSDGAGMIYTEIILKKEQFTMNNIIKAGQPTALKDLISYEEGSVAKSGHRAC